jgi:hypothetical protein
MFDTEPVALIRELLPKDPYHICQTLASITPSLLNVEELAFYTGILLAKPTDKEKLYIALALGNLSRSARYDSTGDHLMDNYCTNC